jgi:DNA (cytosine-5)-methyltransferase 1
MKSIELFVGAGGLAIGTNNAGFSHEAVVEWDADACETIRENQRRQVAPLSEWPLTEGDVAEFDFAPFEDKVDLLSGGPPCQPFSLGGKHSGHADQRNMFPEVFRAVREVRPRAILIENVKGLLRESFAKYFEYIYLQLSYPELRQHPDEGWQDHLIRLERHHTAGSESGLNYKVVYRLLNAADYGVPQRRERVFIVGIRGDRGIEWGSPAKSHTRDALLRAQWVSGDYWERHGIPKSERPELPARLAGRVERLRQAGEPAELPWRTVRDALKGLPDPVTGDSDGVLNHWANPGARTYAGHTGSPLDEPAKTLKAGVHGVPGGENILAMPSGDVRYFTLREAARLQTFPDDYYFPRSWTESMRQLGNAVPVRLAEAVSKRLYSTLESVAKEKGRLDRPGAVQPAGQGASG